MNNHLFIEQEIFARIAGGDETAFCEAFYHYGSILHPVILKIVKEPDVAEDIVSEVFLKLWLYRDRVSDIQNPSGWLYKIATRLAFTYLSKNKRHRQILEKIYSPVLADMQQGSEQNIEVNELSRIIDEAITQLPPQRRKIYQMSREAGLSRKEIAAELGLSENTIRNQLMIAMQHIHSSVKKYYSLGILLLIFLLKK